MAQTSTSSLAYTLNADSFEFLGSATPLRPTESFTLPHYDFLSFLSVAQQAGANFLPTTWAPGLNGLGIGYGLDHIDLSPSHRFSFKRFIPDSKEARTLGLEDVQGFSWKALMAEVLVLQHPQVQRCSGTIDLYGISWDVQVNRSGKLMRVLPVLVFEKPVYGSLDMFFETMRYQALPFDKKLSLCRDIGKAIEIMHSFNIPHGEIKPEKVLIFEDGNGGFTAKIIDFGYSCLGCDDEEPVRMPLIPKWSSPECTSMEPTIGRAKKADIYSYGKICGRILFGGKDSKYASESLFSLSSGEGEGHKFVIKDHELVRAQLTAFFSACLEVDPEARTGDMGMLVELISKALGENSQRAPTSDEFVRYEDLRSVPNLLSDFGFWALQHVHCFVRAQIVTSLTERAITCKDSAFQLAICHEFAFGTPRDAKLVGECLQKCGKSAEDLLAASENISMLGNIDPTVTITFPEEIEQLIEEYTQTGILSTVLDIYKYEVAGKVAGGMSRPSLILQNILASLLFDQGLIDEAIEMQKKLLDQVTKALGSEESPHGIIAMQNLVRLLTRQGSLQGLELDLQRKVLEKTERILGLSHLATLIAAWDLATMFRYRDEPEESMSVLLKMTEKIKGALGESSFQTLLSMQLLADIYLKHNRAEEALKLNQNVLNLMIKELGEKHPQTMASMSYKAMSLQVLNLGSTEESTRLQTRVFEMRRSILGEENPDTIRAMISVAQSLEAPDQRGQALKLKEQAIESITKILGEYHPRTIIAMNSLAEAYRDHGLMDGIVKIQKRVLGLQTKALGKDHPGTISAMEAFIEVLVSQNEFAEASALQRQLLDIKVKILGEEHPSTIAALNNVGFMLTRQDKVDEAIKIQRRVLELTVKVLGDEHPDNIPVMMNMVQTLVDNHQMDEAIDTQKKVAALREKISGKEDPDTLRQLNDLAYMLAIHGRTDQAVETQKRVLETSKSIFGEDHPNTLSAMANISSILRMGGDADEALAMQLQILDINVKSVGENHEDTVKAMETLVVALLGQNQVDKALEIQRRIVKAREGVSGEEDIGTIEAMEYLSQLLAKKGHLEEASNVQERVVSLKKKVSGDDHPETLTSMSNYAYLLARQEKTGEAAKIQQQVVDMMMKVLGKEHPETVNAKGNLDFMRAAEAKKDAK